MANRRNKSGRYDEPFVGFPKSVLESNSLRDLSPHACKLLFEIARQYKGDNNGNLTAAWTILKSRGWRSKTTLYRCKKELLERGLIYMTRNPISKLLLRICTHVPSLSQGNGGEGPKR